MLKYIDFYRKNRDLYVGTQDVASVAILRSYASITYNHARAGLSAILVEQALIQAKIPFHMIFDEHLESLSPSLCKVLILPDSECLSDAQVAFIRGFVEAGGGLIATEQSGLYDTWRRVRLAPALQGLVAGQGDGKSSEAMKSATTHNEVGKGRVAYIPAIEFDGTLPPPEPYFTIGTSLWKRPKNWAHLLDAILWASRGDIPLEVKGPEYLIANLTEQPDRRRRLVHLVNCDTEHVSAIENVKVRCAMPAGQSAATVRFYSPDASGAQELKSEFADGMVSFTVPRFNVYGVAELSA
jgi:hypothetical protein